MKRVCEFIRECGAFMLLTVNDGKPAGRPFGAVTEIGVDFFISAGAGKAVFDQLQRNGNVQLLALKHGTRDWARVSGFAEETFSLEIKSQMLADCPNLLKYHKEADDATFHVFRIRVESAELHTANGVQTIR